MKNYFKKFSIMFVMSLILMLGSCVSAFAADDTQLSNFNQVIYVDAINGNDANGDGSESKPYKTIDYAKTKINTTNALINLGEGTYLAEKLSGISLVDKTITYIGKGEKTILEFSTCGSNFNGDMTINKCTLRPSDIYKGDYYTVRFLNYGNDSKNIQFNNCLFTKSANGVYPTDYYFQFSCSGDIFTNKNFNNCTFAYVICQEYPDNEAYKISSSAYGKYNSCATATKFYNFPAVKSSYDTTSFVNATYDSDFKLTNGDNSLYGVYSGKTYAWGNNSSNNECISLDNTSMNLQVGNSQQLIATTTLAGAEVIWSSSDTSIATVDSNGKVTGVKEGQATITATTTDGSNLSSTCTVNVTAEPVVVLPTQTTSSAVVLNIEPAKTNIYLNETVSANLAIDNITNIAAEDILINYDSNKLEFLGAFEVDGIKIVAHKNIPGQVRLIVASEGKNNIINSKKILLKLYFKGKSGGQALIDITKGKVSDGIELEKDLKSSECGETIINVGDSELKDVNFNGVFTLLDLAIDARHYGENPATLTKYNTDQVLNGAIDNDDLLKIGEYMLKNTNYSFN